MRWKGIGPILAAALFVGSLGESSGAVSDRAVPNGKVAWYTYGCDGYSGDPSDIWVANPDGTDKTALLGIEGCSPQVATPDWSPDGSRLAFVTDRDGDSEIYILAADGSSRRRVTMNHVEDTYPEWASSGHSLLFSSFRRFNFDIYRIEDDGSGEKNLTDHPAYDASPEWSPDGTRIVFGRTEGGESPWDVWVMEADGSGQVNLTNDGANDVGPVWSPDGQRIAFVSDFALYVMNVDGTGRQELAGELPDTKVGAVWSPDGLRIAFVTNDDPPNNLYLVDADGSDLTNLPTGGSYWVGSPRWSPDSSALAMRLGIDEECGSGDYGWDVGVIGADGTGFINLSADHCTDSLGPDWQGPDP